MLSTSRAETKRLWSVDVNERVSFLKAPASALISHTLRLQEECGAGRGGGELLLSLCHQPAARRLSVVILKARNVPVMDITGFSGED